MKLKRDARTLKAKAISSLRRGLSAFNSYDEDARVTTVLLHLQHACEMLLKALLLQSGVAVFDKKSGISLGFAKCVNLALASCGLQNGEAGTIRAVDSLRDAEQHWLLIVSEELLFMHARALVTVIDDVLKRSFDDSLGEHLPTRVLPVSASPFSNIDVLMDREYSQIQALLAPGRRARDEARGRIRALLAMEAHVVEEVAVSERDLNRIEKAARAHKPFAKVFPRLATIATDAEGEGIQIKVHFTKKQGAPVTFVSGDDPGSAAAIRELDLRKKYHLSRADLATALGLTAPKAAALRSHLKIDSDPSCLQVFEFGKSKFPCYSDNAVRRMKEGMKEADMAKVWEQYQRRR